MRGACGAGPRRGALLGALGALWITGCIGDPGPLSFIQVTGADSPGEARGFVLRKGENGGGNAAEMGAAAGDVGAVEYLMSERYRPYLLSGDLEQGIAGGAFLALPRSLDTVMRYEGVERPELWTSFRVVDAGRCSAFVPWKDIAGYLVGALDARLRKNPAAQGITRTSAGRVTPVLRARRAGAPYLSEDDDSVRLEATYHADRIGAPGDSALGCDDVTLTAHIEVGFRPVTGAVHHTADCRFPGEAGRVIEVPGSRDFEGVVRGVSVDVDAPACPIDGFLRVAIEQALEAVLPGATATTMRNRLLRDPRDLGIAPADIRPCECDSECDLSSDLGPAYPGARHRCHHDRGAPAGTPGECWVQLEADRLAFRPEGLEVVLSDGDDDPQMGLFTSNLLLGWYLCSPTRHSRSPYDGPDLGTMKFPVYVRP